jgi:hypothetical protein
MLDILEPGTSGRNDNLSFPSNGSVHICSQQEHKISYNGVESKLTFVRIGVCRGWRCCSRRLLVSVSRTGVANFSFNYILSYPHKDEWTLFQTQYC